MTISNEKSNYENTENQIQIEQLNAQNQSLKRELESLHVKYSI